MDLKMIDRPFARKPHPTTGHYRVVPTANEREIYELRCQHCAFSAVLRQYQRPGDRSGQGRYNRARAAMVKHLYAQHRVLLGLLPKPKRRKPDLDANAECENCGADFDIGNIRCPSCGSDCIRRKPERL